jgi:chorismate mutase
MAEGRGRLSSLDLVPEEGQDDIRWALGELNERRRSAADILFELNDRLTGKGLGDFIISKSAFNRKSVAIARAASRIKMSREIFTGIAEHLTPENIDKANIALAEFIKALIAEIISQAEDGGLSADEAMKLARGFQAVVLAQKQSTDRRAKAEKDEAARVEKTADALGAAAKEAGLSAETVAKLRRDFLGMAG